MPFTSSIIILVCADNWCLSNRVGIISFWLKLIYESGLCLQLMYLS